MLHLLVEACIARNLIDTSAYFWPGYVVPSAPSKDSLLVQESPWSTFMEGAAVNGSLKNALLLTPATRYFRGTPYKMDFEQNRSAYFYYWI